MIKEIKPHPFADIIKTKTHIQFSQTRISDLQKNLRS